MYKYDKGFYEWIDRMTLKDAEIILPQVIDWLKPKSIVDFGCGEGLWLSVAKKTDKNISILGLDGDYVEKSRLKIPRECFEAADLRKPVRLKQRYDLAVSTEVAEHIDIQNSDDFINNITAASDHILFSASVPGQGGINHVNEQWQSYWIKMFEQRGYIVDLSIRNFFWNESRITGWRKQNLLYFSKDKEQIAPCKPLYDVVHPEQGSLLRKLLEETTDEFVYCMRNPQIYAKLDSVLEKIVAKNKNIVIYPFGNNGKLCKRILNGKYGVKEILIIDNFKHKECVDVFPVNILGDIKEKFVIIDTCSNGKIHKEVLSELQKFVNSDNIYTVFRTGDISGEADV